MSFYITLGMKIDFILSSENEKYVLKFGTLKIFNKKMPKMTTLIIVCIGINHFNALIEGITGTD